MRIECTFNAHSVPSADAPVVTKREKYNLLMLRRPLFIDKSSCGIGMLTNYILEAGCRLVLMSYCIMQ